MTFGAIRLSIIAAAMLAGPQIAIVDLNLPLPVVVAVIE
jgi:hypothetical protein